MLNDCTECLSVIFFIRGVPLRFQQGKLYSQIPKTRRIPSLAPPLKFDPWLIVTCLACTVDNVLVSTAWVFFMQHEFWSIIYVSWMRLINHYIYYITSDNGLHCIIFCNIAVHMQVECGLIYSGNWFQLNSVVVKNSFWCGRVPL